MRDTYSSGPGRLGLTLLAALWFALGFVGLAAAQGAEPIIERSSLRLWPEYDDPGLLVIASGVFTDSVSFPRDVAFPLPAGARAIQATVDNPDAGLLTRPFEIKDGKLTYSLPLPGYHIEYYVDREESDSERAITYTFEAPYRINALEVAVQQPARSTDFTVSPEPTGSFVGSDGLTYYTFTRENLAAGDKFDIVIRYAKQDNNFSISAAAPVVQPTLAPVGTIPDSSGVPDWLPWVLIVAGTIGIAGAVGFWLWQQRKAALAAPGSQPLRPTVSSQPGPTPAAGSGAFCTQCGRSFGPNDRFCAQCGAARRR